MTTVVIVILNWNGKENTLQCLESIKNIHVAQSTLQTVVVDNGSEEEFIIQPFDFAQGENSEVRIIRNKENLGYSGGNNVGIRYALAHGANYVLILNNDTIVDENLVIELLKVAHSDKNIGIVAPKIYFEGGFEFHKDRYQREELGKVIWYAGGIMDWKNVMGHHLGVDEVDYGQYDKMEETDFASGCCMLVRREVFEKVGMFDERYYLYYEDADLSEKSKRAGFEIVHAPKAVLWHKNAGSAGGSGSALQDYYISRNRMRFGLQYAPLRSKLALIRESIGLLIWGRFWQRRGVLDFYLGRFGRGSYPL